MHQNKESIRNRYIQDILEFQDRLAEPNWL